MSPLLRALAGALLGVGLGALLPVSGASPAAPIGVVASTPPPRTRTIGAIPERCPDAAGVEESRRQLSMLKRFSAKQVEGLDTAARVLGDPLVDPGGFEDAPTFLDGLAVEGEVLSVQCDPYPCHGALLVSGANREARAAELRAVILAKYPSALLPESADDLAPGVRGVSFVVAAAPANDQQAYRLRRLSLWAMRAGSSTAFGLASREASPTATP
ncbi:hypothetical protein LBMAG42_33390 [Deltaproteobacteria bacterium]|nr:hypothetical protein LBMAG42_33390 [Deltaproteobacteria bacterium]